MDRRKLFTALLTAGVLILLTPLVLVFVRSPGPQPDPIAAELFPFQDALTNKWGYLDMQGDVVIPAVFVWAGDFRHGRGLAEAMIPDESGSGEKRVAGYIDTDFKQHGDWAIAPRFELADEQDVAARAFFDGLAAARGPEGKWGYIDTDGGWAIEPRFEASEQLPGWRPCGDFHDGLAWFVEVRIKVRNALDADGHRINDDQGDPVTERYPVVQYGYINLKGDIVIPASLTVAQDFGQGLAAVRYRFDDNWGFIDRTENKVITAQFTAVGRFSEDLCPARDEDDLWGYIDTKGKWVIEPRFAEAREFSQGLAPARMPDERWGYINAQGSFIIYPQFDDDPRTGMYNDPKPFDGGLARVLINDSPCYINTDGDVVWPKDE